MNEVTRIINEIQQGDNHATEELLPLVYEELRLLAVQKMSQEKPGQTLQATALVHEAYIRLLGGDSPGWDGRIHFFAAAAEAMRRILIANARRKRSIKRGGSRKRVDLDKAVIVSDEGVDGDDLIAMNEALEKLSAQDKIRADVVKLRYFAGLTFEQTGEILSISTATAKRHWAYARAWLIREMG